MQSSWELLLGELGESDLTVFTELLFLGEFGESALRLLVLRTLGDSDLLRPSLQEATGELDLLKLSLRDIPTSRHCLKS